MRGLAKYGYTSIISSSPKSGITKVFLSDFRKVFDRHTHFQEKQPLDLSKPVIKRPFEENGLELRRPDPPREHVPMVFSHSSLLPILMTLSPLWTEKFLSIVFIYFENLQIQIG